MIEDIKQDLDVIEVYPKIFVYKNLFKNIGLTYEILKNSDGTDGLFSQWTQWSSFGEYLNPTFKGYDHVLRIEDVERMEAITEKEKEHKMVLLEILNNFYTATKDYILKNNVDFDDNKYVPGAVDVNNNPVQEWLFTGPSIARYRIDNEDDVAMTYHTDYIREPIISPGYKFAITALTYFNDDYEGGEIDFIANGEAKMYKPEAGDVLIFPSGHPDLLMSESSIYLHGVMPIKNKSKYLARMYWTKYSVGDDLWFKKEEEFGKDIWKSMQSDIMQKFRDENPNKISAEKERRIS
jgi:hypothetical protein